MIIRHDYHKLGHPLMLVSSAPNQRGSSRLHPVPSLAMKPLLAVVYLLTFAVAIGFKDRFLGNDIAVAAVAAFLLLFGLALWVWSVQSGPNDERQPTR